MNDQFTKFKKRITVHAVIESSVIALAAALIVVAAVLLPLSLQEIYLNPGIYVAIGLGAAVLCGGTAALFLFPTEKRVARRLDKDLVMHEKVQTLVAYSSSEDSMAVIQRADTNDRLAAAGLKTVKFKRLWQCAVSSAVAVILFVVAVVMAIIGAPEAPPVLAGINEYMIVGLNNIISVVNKSAMEKTPKEQTVAELEQLKTSIEPYVNSQIEQEVLFGNVINTMLDIDEIVDATINAEPIGLSLRENTGDTLLLELGAHIASLNRETTGTGFNSIIGTFKNQKSDSEDEEEAPAMTSARQSELAVAYSLCLDDALNQPEFKQVADCTIAREIIRLGEMFDAIPQKITELSTAGEADKDIVNSIIDYVELTVNGVQKDADEEAAPGIAENISLALANQINNRNVFNDVVSRLQQLFGIPDNIMPDFGEPITDIAPSEEGGDSESGGAGRGDELYGSDSEIYDYDEDDYVKYGSVLEEAMALIRQLYEGESLSAEDLEVLDRFMQILNTGLEDKE